MEQLQRIGRNAGGGDDAKLRGLAMGCFNWRYRASHDVTEAALEKARQLFAAL